MPLNLLIPWFSDVALGPAVSTSTRELVRKAGSQTHRDQMDQNSGVGSCLPGDAQV